MELSHWQTRQTDAARELTNQGSQALRAGQVDQAVIVLEEASAILDMADADDLEAMKIQAQVSNELGFVRQKQGRLEEAEELHRAASIICDELIANDVDFRGNAAATHINLAGILAQRGELDDAKKVNLRAAEMADALVAEGEAPIQAFNLAFGAHQNLAVIAAKADDFDTAHSEMEIAIELIRGAGEDAVKQVSAQVAQGAQQISVLLFHAGEFERALQWGQEAEKFSENAYEAHGEPVISVYVTSQINLISFHEKAGNFAAGEDALFKALDVVGNNLQILERGKAFYESCRKQADARLEEGNLPREEVEESYKEVLRRLEETPQEGEATDS